MNPSLDDLKRNELGHIIFYTESNGNKVVPFEDYIKLYTHYEQLQSKLDKVCAALEKVKHNGCCMVCSSACPACNAHITLNEIRKKDDNNG